MYVFVIFCILHQNRYHLLDLCLDVNSYIVKQEDGHVEFEIPNDFAYVRFIRDYIATEALNHEFDEERCTDIQIITDELCNNAIEHGSPILEKSTVQVIIDFKPKEIKLEVKDSGKGVFEFKNEFTDEEKKQLDFRQELSSIKRGRGLFLVRELSDEYDFDINPETGSALKVVIRCLL